MPNNFDRIAFAYDRLAGFIFGQSINTAQDCFLESVPVAASVLILGGGSGRVLIELLARNPKARITYLEASQAMLDLTRERLKDWPEVQVKLIKGTEQVLAESQHQFDVIITQFVLDVYKADELPVALGLLDQSIKPSGKWIFADFCLETSWYRRWWQYLLIKVMYLFFALITNISTRVLLDFEPYLRALGWKLIKSKKFYRGMILAAVFEKG